MRSILTLFLIAAAAALMMGTWVQVSGEPANLESEGKCCLCTLHYDEVTGSFNWSCPCNFAVGAQGCTINSEGCHNVGVCP